MGKINVGSAAYVDEREPVLVPRADGTQLTLFVRKLGFLEMTNLHLKARAEGVAPLSMLVAETVEDDEGNRFTIEEVGRLRKEVAEPLTAAALKINKIADEGEGPN
ncbi:hypothetical protein [Lysobacter fragariae]